jgi:probable phosphoglycerate mutase
LIVIRHLPTEYNRLGLLQGRLDMDIVPPNRSQLDKIAENRREIQRSGPVGKILCSRLKRTASTALLYGYAEGICEREPLLDELDFGRFEGCPRQEMLNVLGAAWFENPQALVLGEPVLKLKNRIAALIEKYRYSRRLLLFGHGAWTRALLSITQTGDVRDMNRIIVENNRLVRVEI